MKSYVRFDEALLRVWRQERDKPHVKYTTNDYRAGEDGPAHLRALMPEEFQHCSLTAIRTGIHRLTSYVRETKRNGRPKRHPVDRAVSALKKLSTTKKFSDEYLEYIASDLWISRSRRHKEECDYRCQLCTRQMVGSDLHVHHIYYREFDGNEKSTELLCVCAAKCHHIADGLRQWGSSQQSLCDHGNEPTDDSDFQFDCSRERRLFG